MLYIPFANIEIYFTALLIDELRDELERRINKAIRRKAERWADAEQDYLDDVQAARERFDRQIAQMSTDYLRDLAW